MEVSAAAPRSLSQRSVVAGSTIAVFALAALVLALHLATNGLYDFHRDELYYLDSARHLTWGFVDYPPVTPAIARLSLALFGTSVWGLRLWPSLAAATMVILAAAIARELGGGSRARVLAALAAATSLLLLGANWLFQTVTFDQLAWITALWVFARLLRTRDRRLWLALTLVIGVGLETKYTIVALAAGLILATVTSSLRRDLRSPWPWLGLLLVLAAFAPNLVWQALHGWPSITYTTTHQGAQSFSPLSFLAGQLAYIGPLAIPLWIAGCVWLLAHPSRRPLGVAGLFAFVVFLLVGKGYYPGPIDPVFLAACMCWLERRPGRGRLRAVAATALVLQALVLLPIALPLMPESVMASQRTAVSANRLRRHGRLAAAHAAGRRGVRADSRGSAHTHRHHHRQLRRGGRHRQRRSASRAAARAQR